jgi:hypothetical protein
MFKKKQPEFKKAIMKSPKSNPQPIQYDEEEDESLDEDEEQEEEEEQETQLPPLPPMPKPNLKKEEVKEEIKYIERIVTLELINEKLNYIISKIE